jgi:O-antigen ligase
MIGAAARAAFFVLLPAFSVGGALGVPVLICLAGALSLRPSLLRQAVENRPLALMALLGFLALSIASAAWSDYGALRQAAKIAVLVPLGLLFTAAAAADRRLTRAAGVAAFAILAILLAVEALWSLPLNRAAQPETASGELLRNVSRGATLLLALTFPAAATLMARGGRTWSRLGLLALAAGGFISLQFGQFANTLAFAAGLIAFFTAFAAPRLAVWSTIAVLLAWLLAAPFATPFISSYFDPAQLPYSWNARLEIWSYICERIREQPWIGHGLDAARAHEPQVPVHPHSASLQIWFETGVLGALFAATLFIVRGRALARGAGGNRPAAAAAAGALAALGVVANLSYNLWAEWWLAAFFVAAGMAGALLTPRK